jgi:hypothetical protein
MAPFADLRSPAAFECFVDHDIERATSQNEGLDEQCEQTPTRLQWRPTGAVQHLVKGTEMGILLLAGVPEGCGHGAPTVREERATQQCEHFLPGRGGK